MVVLHLTFGITIGLLLILAGFLFSGKGIILINGVMFLPKEARDKINKKALGRFIGSMLLVVNVFMALMWIDIAWLETSYLWLTWVATGLLIIATVIYIVIGILNREKWFSLPKKS